MLDRLHQDAALVLINRGLLVRDEDMEKNVGRTVRYINWKPSMGTQARDHVFKVVGVQLDYRGEKVYRVVCEEVGDTFGRTAAVDEIVFL